MIFKYQKGREGRKTSTFSVISWLSSEFKKLEEFCFVLKQIDRSGIPMNVFHSMAANCSRNFTFVDHCKVQMSLTVVHRHLMLTDNMLRSSEAVHFISIKITDPENCLGWKGIAFKES